MKALLLLPILLITSQVADPPVTVVNFKWTKTRQTTEKLEPAVNAPAAAMIPANKNFERNRRINDPAGVRDPNQDTIDGRSAALERSVQEARTPKQKTVDAYQYRLKLKNSGSKSIDVVFWEYQFIETANPSEIAKRQFLCGVSIKPDKEKDVEAFSLLGPSGAISAASLANKSDKVFDEKIVINRIEFADGTIWQRKDWNFAEIKLTLQRALSTPWGAEMCRAL